MSRPTVWASAVRGAGSETVQIDIYDSIGGSFSEPGFTAKNARNFLKANAQAKRIELRINSSGGDVVDGLSIYNQLRDHPAHVDVEVDALAASMASVILMAGDTRRMASNAQIMVHEPWSIVVGKSDELRKQADILDRFRSAIVDIYEERTGQPRDAVVAAMQAETWMDATEAAALGYIDTITPRKAMVAAAAWDLTEYRNVPAAVREMLGAPRSAGGGTNIMERRFDEYTRDELTALALSDKPAFNRLYQAHLERKAEIEAEPWRFKTYAAMSFGEKHKLWCFDADLAKRMKADPTQPAQQ